MGTNSNNQKFFITGEPVLAAPVSPDVSEEIDNINDQTKAVKTTLGKTSVDSPLIQMSFPNASYNLGLRKPVN